MAGINPELLTWARETAGLDRAAAARKIGLNAARGVSGADRLAAIETGELPPTAALLRRMAKHYHRPILVFYMREVPAASELGQDFRTLPDEGDPSDILLATLLRDVKARQALVREALEDDDDSIEVLMVGSQRGVADARQLAEALADAIGFNRSEYRAKASPYEAFSFLRSIVESQGIFVLLAGDCGSWQTAIETKIFRGFAIADSLAPFIVINDQDARSAWSFTLLHELAHLLLGESGISGGVLSDGVERLCNDTAAAVLVDPAEIVALDLDPDARDTGVIDHYANRFRVSRTMLVYQLYRAQRLTLERWEELRDGYRSDWLASKAADREKHKASDSGPNWYVVRRHRLGAALLKIARQGIADGSLTPSRAARMLGVKPTSVYPLLADISRQAKSA